MRATLCCVVFFPFFSRLRSKERVSERARLERYRLIEGGREGEREVEGGGGGRGCLVLLWVNLRTTLLSSPHRSLPLLPPLLLPIPSPHSLTSYTLPSHTPPPFLLPLSLSPSHASAARACGRCLLAASAYISERLDDWTTGCTQTGLQHQGTAFYTQTSINLHYEKERQGWTACGCHGKTGIHMNNIQELH